MGRRERRLRRGGRAAEGEEEENRKGEKRAKAHSEGVIIKPVGTKDVKCYGKFQYYYGALASVLLTGWSAGGERKG
jgi:hypothetical protein